MVELQKKTADIQGPINHLAISSGQTRLFACSDGNVVVEYNLQTAAVSRTLGAADGSAVGGFGRVAVSADDSKLLAAGSKIFLWDLTTGQQTAAFVGHASRVQALAFLPSSKYFISADADKFLAVWPARNSTKNKGKGRKKLKTHTKAKLKLIASADVAAVHVQPADGKGRAVDVCSLCTNGNVDLWRVDVKKHKTAAPLQPHGKIECERGDTGRSDSDEGSGVNSNGKRSAGLSNSMWTKVHTAEELLKDVSCDR